ncbi:MAG: hypothetical protein QXW47_09985 [Candidatus Jordarchaeales archaeon]
MEGDEKAALFVNQMNNYLNYLNQNRMRERLKILYRAMPKEFDTWGGLDFLVKNYPKISSVALKLYPPHDEKLETILKVARKRWNI